MEGFKTREVKPFNYERVFILRKNRLEGLPISTSNRLIYKLKTIEKEQKKLNIFSQQQKYKNDRTTTSGSCFKPFKLLFYH